MPTFLSVLTILLCLIAFVAILADVTAGLLATYRGRDRRKSVRPGNAPHWGSHTRLGG